jgi:hypothetical protein
MGIELDTERPDVDDTGWSAPVAPTVRPGRYGNGLADTDMRGPQPGAYSNKRILAVRRPSDDPLRGLWEQPPAQQDLSPIRGTPAWRAALVGDSQ